MFGNHGTDSAEATDNELLTEDCKKSLFATLKCIGVTFMATNQNTPIKKIAISTGGGDAPGLNAVIRACNRAHGGQV